MDAPDGTRRLHRFSEGRPQDLVFQEIDSCLVHENERYAFWTDMILRGVEVAAPGATQQADFRAAATSLATRSSEMHWAEADGYGTVRTRAHIRSDDHEDIALSYVIGGRLHSEYEDDARQVLRAGDFYLTDLSRPSRFHFQGRHRMVQVLLPRPLLATIFPDGLPLPGAFTRALKASRLGPMLGAQMREAAKLAVGGKPAEQAAMLEGSEALALALLEGAFANASPRYEDRADALYLAADRYIRRHLRRHDLRTEEIAAALGCSRTTLYRVFKLYDLTVSDHIRELRLQRLKQLLLHAPNGPTIAALAQRCGLHDAANLTGMFRQRFGMSPRQMRAERTRS